MKKLVIIPARAGSKRLPNKNLKLLGGKPLIMHSVEIARKFFNDNEICVSTDSSEIKTIVESMTASNTFFESIYFLPFLKLGAGSYPLPPPKYLIGWHRKILFTPKNNPLKNPLNFKESIKKSEHVGRYLQFDGKYGEIKYLYNFIIKIKRLVKSFMINDLSVLFF